MHLVDQAISSSTDLRMTLDLLLEHVATQLQVDATDVLLLNPHALTLEYAAGRGFRTIAATKAHVRLGQGLAGRAALERRMTHLGRLADAKDSPRFAALQSAEGFSAYYAVPLIAKGHVVGVLEVFSRAPISAGSDWVGLLETLAGQAAIAIENAQLFEGMQRSNFDLSLAYDATIEGWSHALDLRDKETEGHTQRVVEMTMRLARAMGISDAELVHVRRGALLHDIGKMGVPDGILLKPGPLTEEEWVLMRRHPQLAYDMLAPIAFLRPALDIPLCHHERMDGGGYPRGLAGRDIPLAARIFAVVDVWDALRSDRPYRLGWTEEAALAHIRAGAGTHFDPNVVEVFLCIVDEAAGS
jgi:putative nucleotidyltransferase with HDIG domain